MIICIIMQNLMKIKFAQTFEPIVDMQRIEQQVTELVTENEALKQTVQAQQTQIDELTLLLGDALVKGVL